MSNKKPNARRTPDGQLPTRALDALDRYVRDGLLAPGDVLLPELYEKLAAREADAE